MTPPDSTAVRAPTARVPHLSATAVAWIRVKIPRAVPAANDAAQARKSEPADTARARVVRAPAATTAIVRGRTESLATIGP